MIERFGDGPWVRLTIAAVRTTAGTFAGWTIENQRSAAGTTIGQLFASFSFIQLATGATDNDMIRVSPVFGQQMAGEQVERLSALNALAPLDPEKVFDVGTGLAMHAARAVSLADPLAELLDEPVRPRLVGCQIDVLDLLAHDPI
ncbi:MAG: hypothetical protein ACREHD_23195, partial [Pirellulales bacterium]